MLFQLCMNYLSFAPLWVVIIIIDSFSIYDKDPNIGTESISILMIVIGFMVSLVIVSNKLQNNNNNGDNVKKMKLVEASEEKFTAAEFLMSFILPFFAFDFTKYRSVIYFMIFFLTFEWICCRHNYFCVNVVIEAKGYKIYNCEVENNDNIKIKKKILSKRLLPQFKGGDFNIKNLNNEYMIEIGNMCSNDKSVGAMHSE